MSPKTGRPKVDKPKGVNLTIRLDEETAKRLAEYCAQHNISRGEAVRCGVQLLLTK